MNKRKRLPEVFYYVLIITLICIDQFTKFIAYTTKIDISGKYSRCFKIFPIINRGVSFGLFSNELGIYYITIITLLLIFFFIWCYKIKKTLSACPLPETLIIAGGISNLIDRFIYGGVVDFILAVFIEGYALPVANIADCYIVTGLLFLAYEWIYYKEKDFPLQGSSL
jgi:signal peptidase II